MNGDLASNDGIFEDLGGNLDYFFAMLDSELQNTHILQHIPYHYYKVHVILMRWSVYD